MLTAADNEALTRVGPGTVMGDYIRQFWLPALLASEVEKPDGAPVRIRLLGEDLVAFRATDSRISLLQEHCPHRGASLALGVNADCGIRCLYHGWKFSVDGACLDTPTEPDDSAFKSKVRATSYKTHEAGGMVWAYMGPPGQVPAFPNFEWFKLPAANAVPFKVLEECNYAQAVEGTVDSAHAGVLHRESPWGAPAKFPHEKDLHPTIEVEQASYGFRYGAIRKLDDERNHARITQVVLPFYTLIPPHGAGPFKDRRLVNAFVPRDDVSTWHIQWFFDETQPIDVAHRIEEGGIWLDEGFRKQVHIGNWYNQDREMMRTENMSGIKGIMVQDHAVNETQGPILDRTQEHLGTSDIAVIAWRKMLLQAARALAERGERPRALVGPTVWDRIRAETLVFSNKRTWRDEVPLVDERRAAADTSAE